MTRTLNRNHFPRGRPGGRPTHPRRLRTRPKSHDWVTANSLYLPWCPNPLWGPWDPNLPPPTPGKIRPLRARRRPLRSHQRILQRRTRHRRCRQTPFHGCRYSTATGSSYGRFRRSATTKTSFWSLTRTARISHASRHRTGA